MAGFNYAAKIRNLAFTPGSWPLLSLTVVRDELIIEEGEVTIYAESEARCQQLQAILPTKQGKPVQAELTAQGDDYQQRVNRALKEIALGG